MRTIGLLVAALLLVVATVTACAKSRGSSDPGALVEVSMTSTVGVLLDEIPSSMRDRVADELLAQADPFWEERAIRQVELTDYRLAFREYYYDEEEGKGQLRLPPREIWRIDLNPAGAARAVTGSHDAVVISYTFSSTLLSDRKSPGLVEPELGRIGGTWDEPFVFPIDPELLLQRTGYACIDEAEFPPNSVDAESVRSFYDHECEQEDTPSHEGCHWTELPAQSCLEALDASVGSVTTQMHYERILFDQEIADRVRVGTITHDDGADLVPLEDDLRVNRIIYRYVDANDCAIQEGCVGGQGWRRLLRFDANLKNVGGEPVHIGEIDYFVQGDASQLIDHNVYEYSACHDHYHFRHYGSFTLDTFGGTFTGTKGAFCLETSSRLLNTEDTSMKSDYAGCDYQGITAGWGDEYGSSLDCQWIDITDLDPAAGAANGRLTFEVNPDQFLCEGTPKRDADGDLVFETTSFTTAAGDPVDRPGCDFVEGWDNNNTVGADVFLPEDGGYVTQPCTRGQIGPFRDCGFTEIEDDSICAPGAPSTLDCGIAGGTPMAVRICEASDMLDTGTSCVFRDALSNAVVAGTSSLLQFTCPDSRGLGEPGGRVAIYTAPVWPGDPIEDVTCAP